MLTTYELARKLAGTQVTCNCLHPGCVDTGFARNNGSLYNFGMTLLKPFQKKVSDGASTSIYLATSPEVEKVSGKYFVDSQAVQSDPASYDQAVAARLWQLSRDMLGL